MKPLFGWPESKAHCVEAIVSEFPTYFNNYYEPFLGSAAVYLHMHACLRMWKKSFLSDSNVNLVNCYKSVCDDPERVTKVVEHLCGRDSKQLLQQMLKQTANPSVFIYVARATARIGRNKIDRNVKGIHEFASYVAKHPAEFRSCNWEKALFAPAKSVDAVNPGLNDLVYLDPPALLTTNFVPGGFNESDHVYLNNYARQLKQIGCHVYLSGSINPASLRIYGEPSKMLSSSEGLWSY